MDELRFIDFGLMDVNEIMAVNEALFRVSQETRESVAYTWTTDRSIIMGYSQIIEKELNLERCRELGYKITRRISGGGMAFSSLKSQVQYGFVGDMLNESIPLDLVKSYEKVCGVIKTALLDYGLDSEFKPINDVLCNGKKISGSAQTRADGIVIQHGTLLADFDIREMLLCCNIPLEKISDKGISTVEERLTDLKRELGRETPLERVNESIKKGFEETFGRPLRLDSLTPGEESLKEQLLPKYSDESWVFRYTRGKTRYCGEYPESRELADLARDKNEG